MCNRLSIGSLNNYRDLTFIKGFLGILVSSAKCSI